ncbi:MAG: S9 family peptidase [Ktedonobacterales bacterium]|nr:S9 family peptidase [Ktedonobacterales bacterium]
MSEIRPVQRLPVTPGAISDVRLPLDVALSPDGQRAAFVLYEWVAGRPKRRARIWVVETAGSQTAGSQTASPELPGDAARPFTSAATGSDTSPRWSPDGSRLAFLSTRESEEGKEKAQLYVMSASGGPARRLCDVPNGASDPAWSPDGTRIAFTSPEGPEPERDPIIVGPARHRRLWSIAADGDTPEPITPPNITVWEYAWSPDGKHIAAYYSTGPDETHWYRGQIGIVAASGGAPRQITHLTRQAGALAWSPDGARIAYVSGEWSDRGLVGGDLFIIPAEGGEARNLTPGIEVSVSWAHWFPDGLRLLYAAWDGVTHQVGVIREDTGERMPLARDFRLGEREWPRLSTTSDRQLIAVTHSDQRYPPDVWLGELARKSRVPSAITWRRLTRLNPIAEETLAIAPSERITYEGADDWRIEALFTPPRPHSPHQGKANERLAPPPLVVNVHGGPTSAWQDDWGGGLFTQLLAAHGFAVLRPNVRGSMGRGVAFADAVLGDMGGKDLEDVLAGVDDLARRGLVDGTRVGICGWSYGGFLVAWAISQTNRFKAAVMGAGICDYHSFHAQSNIPDWDMRFVGADPLERPAAYRERSAITHAARITTPTLIVHGERDECVPVNQAYAFYRALSERERPVELAVYPREGHGFTERDHLLDLERRVLRWFETHL